MAGETLDLTLGGSGSATPPPLTDVEHGGIAWDTAVQFIAGDVVSVGTDMYIALSDNTGTNPVGNPLIWYPFKQADEQGGVAWNAGVNYNFGDMVFDEVTERTFWCNASNTSGQLGGDFAADIGFWTMYNESLLLGWMDPNIDGGDAGSPGMVTQTVVNGGAWLEGQYCIVKSEGIYDLLTGTSTTAGFGLELFKGDRLRYNLTLGVFEYYADSGVTSDMMGWFNPTIDGGGPGVPYTVINGSTEYESGDYVIADSEGFYDFVTGLTDATETKTHIRGGDRVTFNGIIWTVIFDEKSKAQGWFNPTHAGGGRLHPIVIDTPFYYQDEYVVAKVDGRYDVETGLPAVAPDGFDIKKGDRLRYEKTTGVWDWYHESEEGLLIGWMDPLTDGGGLQYPIVESSVEYSTGEYVIVKKEGFYHLDTGLTDVAQEDGTFLYRGDRLRFNKLNGLWSQYKDDITKALGWFDATINGGATSMGWELVDGNNRYHGDNYFVCKVAGFYDLTTGLTDPTELVGTEFLVGDRVIYDNGLWSRVPTAALERGGIKWEIDTNYMKGDIVVDLTDDQTYKCNINDNIGNLPSSPLSGWDLLVTEKGGVAYDDAYHYEVGDLVYDEDADAYYKCVGTDVQTQPSTDPANWEPFVLPNEERGGIFWHTSQSYMVGDIISYYSDVAGAYDMYMCTAPHTSSDFTTDISFWRKIVDNNTGSIQSAPYRFRTTTFGGSLVDGECCIDTVNPEIATLCSITHNDRDGINRDYGLMSLSPGDFIAYIDDNSDKEYIYKVVSSAVDMGTYSDVEVVVHNAQTGAFNDRERLQIEILVISKSERGGIAWKQNTNYEIGDMVVYDNIVYWCGTANNGSYFVPHEWNVIGSSFMQDWAPATDYKVDDYVRYVDGGLFFKCLVDHTSGAVFEYDFNTLKYWDNLEGYLHAGRVADQGGIIQQCIQEQVLYTERCQHTERDPLVPVPTVAEPTCAGRLPVTPAVPADPPVVPPRDALTPTEPPVLWGPITPNPIPVVVGPATNPTFQTTYMGKSFGSHNSIQLEDAAAVRYSFTNMLGYHDGDLLPLFSMVDNSFIHYAKIIHMEDSGLTTNNTAYFDHRELYDINLNHIEETEFSAAVPDAQDVYVGDGPVPTYIGVKRGPTVHSLPSGSTDPDMYNFVDEPSDPKWGWSVGDAIMHSGVLAGTAGSYGKLLSFDYPLYASIEKYPLFDIGDTLISARVPVGAELIITVDTVSHDPRTDIVTMTFSENINDPLYYWDVGDAIIYHDDTSGDKYMKLINIVDDHTAKFDKSWSNPIDFVFSVDDEIATSHRTCPAKAGVDEGQIPYITVKHELTNPITGEVKLYLDHNCTDPIYGPWAVGDAVLPERNRTGKRYIVIDSIDPDGMAITMNPALSEPTSYVPAIDTDLVSSMVVAPAVGGQCYPTVLTATIPDSNGIVTVTLDEDITDPIYEWDVGEALMPEDNRTGTKYWEYTSNVDVTTITIDTAVSQPVGSFPAVGTDLVTSNDVLPVLPVQIPNIRRTPVNDDELCPKWWIEEQAERGGIAWKKDINYVVGDMVTESTISYICSSDHTSAIGDASNGSPTSPSQINWHEPIERGGVAWRLTTSYSKGDIVVDLSDDQTYKSNINFNLGNVPSSANSGWDKVVDDELGGMEYNPTKKYDAGTIVTQDFVSHTALVDIALNQSPSSHPMKWTQPVNEERGGIAWKQDTNYKIGDIVVYDNVVYWCGTANDGSFFVPGEWNEVVPPVNPTNIPGIMFEFAGDVAPAGSLNCDGGEHSQADYPELYAVIGDLWNTTAGVAAPAAGNFRIPPSMVGAFSLFTKSNHTVATGTYEPFSTARPRADFQTADESAHHHGSGYPPDGSYNGAYGVEAKDGAYTERFALSNRNSTTDKLKTSGGSAHSHLITKGGDPETSPQAIVIHRCIWTGKN